MTKRSTKARPWLVAVTSDQHANSKLGLCPPEGVRVGGGSRYLPGPAQLWMWGHWEAFWTRAAVLREQYDAKLGLGFNGDAVDGDHHGTVEIISKNMEHQNYIAKRVFSVPLNLKPDWIGVTRGTAAHVGQEGMSEEAMSRGWAEKGLPVYQDPESEECSHYIIRAEFNGRLLDFRHHGRSGGRPWTRQGAVGNLASHIAVEHVNAGERVPDVALRSHKHTFDDSGPRTRPRTIQLPAWQLMTHYAQQVVPESIADIGGVLILVHPDGRMEVESYVQRPALPEVVKP